MVHCSEKKLILDLIVFQKSLMNIEIILFNVFVHNNRDDNMDTSVQHHSAGSPRAGPVRPGPPLPLNWTKYSICLSSLPVLITGGLQNPDHQ